MKLIRENPRNKFIAKDLVTNHEIFGKKEKLINKRGETIEQKAFSKDGLFSEVIFGSFETYEEYSCDCKHTVGKFFEGVTCHKCYTEVKFTSAHIDRCGWIDISGDKYDSEGNVVEKGKGWKIISQSYYKFLEKIIGAVNLKNIINTTIEIAIDGEINYAPLEAIRSADPKQKYWHYGLRAFEQNYHEILEYYFKLNGSKHEDVYEECLDENEVFMDKIIVPTTIIRPATRADGDIKLDELNTIYVNILKSNHDLNNRVVDLDLTQEVALLKIQAQYMQIVEEVIKAISGKTGWIRFNIMGTRLNFMARTIITPAESDLLTDEVEMPYLTFLKLWEYEIINFLNQLKNISYSEAKNIHYNAMLKFDNEVYDIMMKMVKHSDVQIMLNRNPTIAYGSELAMRVSRIKKDMNDMTLSMNNNIATLLNADYDGDVLNTMSNKDKEARHVFRKTFSPTSMLIDPNDGRINGALLQERDYILGIGALLSSKK